MTYNFNPFQWFGKTKDKDKEVQFKEPPKDLSALPSGRVSVPDDENGDIMIMLRGMTKLVTPSFRTELIPIIRSLYKINPDVSIALQDMFKLANTGHNISFPNNTDEEATKMLKHLRDASKRWSNYTAGIDGLVNKFIVQCLVGGAVSIEAVPNNSLDGISTILFIKPETIFFSRGNDGVYQPYQKNPKPIGDKKPEYIKLNTETYMYASVFNDTDEPYGVPPFLAALDSIKGQHDMRKNFKHIMELMGMVGFLEAKMEKPARRGSESDEAYSSRLTRILRNLKQNLVGGLKDGVVVGFKDDHEFKLNSTSASLDNLDKPWTMNQQSVANGLGVNGNLIGVQSTVTAEGASIMLSKMISQLKNIQMIIQYTLEFIYSLELRMAGFNNKGIKVTFSTSTISDEVKVQQGLEYKIRNLIALYTQGIINQTQFAWAMGYDSPAEKEPLIPLDQTEGVGNQNDSAKKQKREADKDTSDRKTRDKNNPSPKRHDQDSRPR